MRKLMNVVLVVFVLISAVWFMCFMFVKNEAEVALQEAQSLLDKIEAREVSNNE